MKTKYVIFLRPLKVISAMSLFWISGIPLNWGDPIKNFVFLMNKCKVFNPHYLSKLVQTIHTTEGRKAFEEEFRLYVPEFHCYINSYDSIWQLVEDYQNDWEEISSFIVQSIIPNKEGLSTSSLTEHLRQKLSQYQPIGTEKLDIPDKLQEIFSKFTSKNVVTQCWHNLESYGFSWTSMEPEDTSYFCINEELQEILIIFGNRFPSWEAKRIIVDFAKENCKAYEGLDESEEADVHERLMNQLCQKLALYINRE